MEAMEVRRLIIEDHIRPDGRKIDEIRPLSASIDLLARTHGSALFTRGQTQALATTTLGALGEHQVLDGLELEDEKDLCYTITSHNLVLEKQVDMVLLEDVKSDMEHLVKELYHK